MATARTDKWERYVRDLGVTLARRRHDLGLSQERVAGAAGLTRGYYQQLERGASRTGRVANPTLQTLVALAHVLGDDGDVAALLPPDAPDVTADR